MSRVPNHPPKPDRIVLTQDGLALVKGEPIQGAAARSLLEDIDRQLAQFEAKEKPSK